MKRNGQAGTATIDANGDVVIEEDTPDLGPLFELDDTQSAAHEYTTVLRLEPIDEGRVGRLPADANEESVIRKWGGGEFTLQAKNAKGRIITQRTVRLAGEPLFENDLARKKWERKRRQELADPDAPAAAAPITSSAQGFSFAEFMAMQDAKEKAAEAAHRREIERLKVETQAREAERTAADDRRRLDDEERRRRDREEAEASRARDREFLAAMAKNDRQQDPIATMGAMMTMIAPLLENRGDGGADAITAAVSRLPETIAEIRHTIQAEKGAAMGATEGDGGEIKLVGALATKTKALVAKLVSQGKTPQQIEAILSRTVDVLSDRAKAPAPRPAAPRDPQPTRALVPKKKAPKK